MRHALTLPTALPVIQSFSLAEVRTRHLISPPHHTRRIIPLPTVVALDVVSRANMNHH